MNSNLPTGTITFLFTDIQGSTPLWEREPEKMTVAVERHHALLRAAIESNGGQVFKIIGDAFCAAFAVPAQAVAAALAAQRSLAAEAWPTSIPIRVRMGLHVGQAEAQANDYAVTHTLNRVARITSAGHGGQVLLSVEVVDLTRGYLPAEVTLRDMGKHRMKGMTHPEYLYQLLAPDLRADFPPLQTLDALPNNLPFQLTSFVGRENEIAEIKTLLNSSRLVTLTGSGGTGKTRLAIEVGTQLLTNFQHGVWMIELATLSDELQIIPAIAQAFGLQELPFNPLKNVVVDYLRDKKLLLILDNCEHLIAACAKVADEYLHQCAGLRVLASSREALGIAGEVAYSMPSLADSESTQLFVDRARAANPTFALTDSNAASIAKICHRLDGIPLAIELAAARTKLLSVDQIAARLDDLFRLLVGGSRTALPRQRTLRALIDWSYDLLSAEEKNLLRIASVFVGGWTLDALEAVSEEPNAIEYLDGLVNKSLVVTEERSHEMRYSLLETIRQYASEKLVESKQSSVLRDRHFIHYRSITNGLWATNYFASEAETQRLISLQVEVENLRAAFEWGLQNDAQDALEIAANTAMSMSMRGGQIEGTAMLKTAMEKFRSLPTVEGDANRLRQEIYAHGCFSLGVLLQGMNEIMYSRSILQEAIAIARELGDKHLLGLGLEMYASVSAMIKADDTLAAAQEGLDIFRELDDSTGLEMAYSNLAHWSTIHGDFQKSEQYVALAQASMRSGAISIQSGFLNMGLGVSARFQGRFDRAQHYLEKGLEIFKRIGNKGLTALLASEIAHTQRAMGNFADAKKTYRETIKVFQDYGNRPSVAHQLESFAMIAVVEEEPQRAAKLLAAAEAIRELTGHERTDEEETEEAQFMSRLRVVLPEGEFSALWAEGKSMTMQQAIEFALENVSVSG